MKFKIGLLMMGTLLVSACGQKPIQTSYQSESIQFRFDSHQILKKYQTTLARKAENLKANPEQVILIEGHTDLIGSDHYNLSLGDHRARSVKEFLMDQGVSPTQIVTVSYGESAPLAHKTSRQDRRVVIANVD